MARDRPVEIASVVMNFDDDDVKSTAAAAGCENWLFLCRSCP